MSGIVIPKTSFCYITKKKKKKKNHVTSDANQFLSLLNVII